MDRHQDPAVTGWYTTVSFGSGPYPMPPRGPWRGHEKAIAAIDRWTARAADIAGTICAAHSVRLVGPYRTRDEARWADISNYSEGVIR